MPFKDVVSGKVTTIVTPEQLAINVGATSGVSMDDLVTLFRTIDIYDPDNQEHLGSVNLAKLNLKVTLLSEKFSVATVTDRVKPQPSSTKVYAQRSTPLKTITSDIMTDDNDPAQVYVKVGEVVQVRRWIKDETGSF